MINNIEEIKMEDEFDEHDVKKNVLLMLVL